MVDPEVLKNKIIGEMHQSHKDWKGSGVKIERVSYKAAGEARIEVNKIGAMYGCHTCLTKLDSDKDQPWIGDHIPPTELSYTATQHHGCSSTTHLFPQCDSCMHQQANFVQELNKNPYVKLTKYGDALINGGWKPNPPVNCVITFGTKVSSSEGLKIQALGVKLGCHSCGRKNPASVYISDHVFPVEFCTSYMEKVFEALGLIYPDAFELRPQCPKCSCYQGSQVLAVRKLAVDFANENGIKVYKY